MRLFEFAVLSLATAAFASPAAASQITISFSAYECGISSSSGTTSHSASLHLAAVAPGTGCTTGTDRNAVIDATLTSAKLFVDSTNDFSGNAADISGWVNILDTITITGGTGSGTLWMNYLVTGDLSVSTDYSAAFIVDSPILGLFPAADWLVCGANAQIPGIGGACPSTQSVRAVNQVVSLAYGFTFGTPLNTQVMFKGAVGPYSPVFLSVAAGSGFVDFDNTAVLQPLVILDSNGVQLGGATAVSDSSFQYAVAAPLDAAVPEPGSMLLLGSGLAGLAAARRRARSRVSATQPRDEGPMTRCPDAPMSRCPDGRVPCLAKLRAASCR